MVIVLSKKPFSPGRRKQEELDEVTAEFIKEFGLLEDDGVTDQEARAETDLEESVRRSMSRTVQNLYDIVFSNDWELFVTVTFDGQKLDRYNYDEVVERYSKLLDNIKQRKAPNMEYIFVPELHKDGAFHFHGLLRNIDGLMLKYAGRKDKKGQKIYNLSDFNLGFNTATYVTDTAKVSTYLIKYISKDLIQTLGESRKRYWSTKGLNRTKKFDLFLPEAEQWKMIDMLTEEDKVPVSVKTSTIEKIGYSNVYNYIVLQNKSESQEENQNALFNFIRSVNGTA